MFSDGRHGLFIYFEETCQPNTLTRSFIKSSQYWQLEYAKQARVILYIFKWIQRVNVSAIMNFVKLSELSVVN